MEQQRLVTYVPKDIFRRVKSQAALEGVDMKKFIEDALIERLKYQKDWESE